MTRPIPLKETWNLDGYDAALAASVQHPRLTVHLRIGGQVKRFIRDRVDRVIDGNLFKALPVVASSSATSSSGEVSDRLTLSLQASNFSGYGGQVAMDNFSEVQSLPLRGAAIQIGTVLLSDVDLEPAGLDAVFLGIVEGAELKPYESSGPRFEMEALSLSTYAHRQIPEAYTDVSHRQIWEGDGSFRFVTDAVIRGDTVIWNGQEAGSTSSISNSTASNSSGIIAR